MKSLLSGLWPRWANASTRAPMPPPFSGRQCLCLVLRAMRTRFCLRMRLAWPSRQRTLPRRRRTTTRQPRSSSTLWFSSRRSPTRSVISTTAKNDSRACIIGKRNLSRTLPLSNAMVACAYLVNRHREIAIEDQKKAEVEAEIRAQNTAASAIDAPDSGETDPNETHSLLKTVPLTVPAPAPSSFMIVQTHLPLPSSTTCLINNGSFSFTAFNKNPS